MSSPRTHAWQTGWDAEAAVARLFAQRGDIVLAHRLKTPFGEIDVLAETTEKMLLVVEVKARKTVTEGLEAVSLRQQQRLVAAVSWYISQHPQYAHYTIRFDCVVVLPDGTMHEVEGAFGDG